MPVAATVVGDPPMPAVGAGFDVSTERGGAAMFDRRHDLELMQAQMPGMRGAIRGPCSPEDVGDLERGAHKPQPSGDRKSIVSGKGVSVRVDLGGSRLTKK